MNLLEIFAQVGEGMGNSILIFVLTLVFSLPLGRLVAFGRMNRWAPLAGLKKSKSPFWRKAAGFRPGPPPPRKKPQRPKRSTAARPSRRCALCTEKSVIDHTRGGPHETA